MCFATGTSWHHQPAATYDGCALHRNAQEYATSETGTLGVSELLHEHDLGGRLFTTTNFFFRGDWDASIDVVGPAAYDLPSL